MDDFERIEAYRGSLARGLKALHNFEMRLQPPLREKPNYKKRKYMLHKCASDFTHGIGNQL